MKNKIGMITWWAFVILYFEIIYRIFVIGDLFTINTLTVLLFSIPWIMIFSIITSLFSPKINRIINIILTGVIMVFTLAQIVYFNFYHSIFSFFSLANGTGQVMQFWQMILEVIKNIWYVFLLILVPVLIAFIFHKKLFNYNRPKLYIFIIFLILMNVGILEIMNTVKHDSGSYSLNTLLTRTHAPMLTINRTGLLTMEVIDVYRYAFGFTEDDDIVSEVAVLDNEEVEYNMLDIDFDTLISNTSNKSVLKMHNYFKGVAPSEKNDYTGLFKGKNLIFITAEGFDKIALDEELTPTLYMMANNGFVFNNYYQPLYTVSTSDGEYMNMTGLIPKEGVWSFSKSSKIKMSYALGNMFKNVGYTTYAFHNHNYKYYDRHKSHPNAGFKYIGCGNGLEKKMNCKHWPNSDYEMMDVTTPYYISAEPFATYYMTVSGHLNYNFYGNNMAYRNKKLVSSLKYSDAVKAYMATQIEFDKSMKLLLERLEAAGKLDDTLIVISPDHYPYGLTKKQLNERSTTDRSDKFENYHTTLIMYNPTLRTQQINKVVSSLDIIPTVYNLFGIDYDSRLLMGRDIFSEEDHIVILSDRSWVTDKGTYNSVNGKFKAFEGQTADQEYISKINSIVKSRFSMSSLILDNDYYKKLGL